MNLTLREQEIVELLKVDPLISQTELSERLGISRSAAAVHISNLMRKGIIRGKGYVITQEAAIVIFGESCVRIDVREQSDNRIDISFGGFAFDACKAFSELNLSAKVVSIIGKDEIGEYLINKMQENQMDITNVYRHPESRSCRTVLLNGLTAYQEKIALSDYKKAAENLEWLFLNTDWILIDPMLQETILNDRLFLTEERLPFTGTHLYVESLDELQPFDSNASLSVIGVANSEKLENYTKKWLQSGKINASSYIITDGHTKLIYMDNNMVIDFPLLPSQCFCVRSRLTFLLAGMVCGLVRHYPIRQAIRIAIGIASANVIL